MVKKSKKIPVQPVEEESDDVQEEETEINLDDNEANSDDNEMNSDEDEMNLDEDEMNFDYREEEKDEDPEDREEKRKQMKKTGVLYFSFIPERFFPGRMKKYFEKLAPGAVGRVYLAPNKYSKSFDSRYSEGWIEIKKKKLAKQIAEMLNGRPVGGKKRDRVSSIIWNVKYLSGFKWFHLVEQLDYENCVGNKRLQAEIVQARKVASAYEEKVEKGEQLRKLEEKVLKQGGQWEQYQRQFTQKKSMKKNFKKQLEAADGEEVMKMIFS